MGTIIDKVLELKDLFNKSIESELDSYEMETYRELFNYLKNEKYRHIEDYRLNNMDISTSTQSIKMEVKKPKNKVEETEDMLKDIYDEMELTIKIIHQKFINEGELEVDDVLLYDSIYHELKKNGYYVEKYRIR